MSPSEFQLRQALQDGEGDGPDADRLIAHALDVRRGRRRRISAIAGGAAAASVVALLASALVGLGGGSTGSNTSSTNGDVAGAAVGARPTSAAGPAGGPAPSAAGSSSGSATSAQSTAACPTTPDRYSLPGGGGLGQFGSTQKLFPADVTALRVCAYPLRATDPLPGSSLLSGADARSVIAALEAAPSVRTNGKCPANINYAGGTVELIGITSTGAETPGVVITLACSNSQATNGTAVRYLSDVPRQLLVKLSPAPTRSTAGTSPATMHGSPVK